MEKLAANGIAYEIRLVGSGNLNVFFGNPECVDVLKEMGVGDLSALTDEEDFILGVMLGYDRLQQCARYLKRKTTPEPVEDLVG